MIKKHPLLQVVHKFLVNHYDAALPVVLGLSGGPDSLALLYLLLEYKKAFPLELAIAHVDHGWRKESGEEALHLEELATSLHLTFHGKKIKNEEISGNLEAACREERLNFFSKLCHKFGYQAILLAHHQDDQAETVLKKLMEGSSLSSCSGMSAVTEIDGLIIWRPLLGIPKNALLKWVEERELSPFFDVTNLDTRFLRARLRTQLIPELGKLFGKGIARPLSKIGNEAQELQHFLQKHLAPFLLSIVKTSWGSFLDLSTACPDTLLENKYLIRDLCRRERCFPSKDIVDTAAHHLLLRSANRKFVMGKHHLYIDRRRLFVYHTEIAPLPQEKIAINGTLRYGSWNVSAEEGEHPNEDALTDWKTLWQGKAEVVLPITSTPYTVGPPKMNCPYPRSSSISRWWNHHNVPAFIREKTPVIWSGEKIAHEFLTGKTFFKVSLGERCQRIKLSPHSEK